MAGILFFQSVVNGFVQRLGLKMRQAFSKAVKTSLEMPTFRDASVPHWRAWFEFEFCFQFQLSGSMHPGKDHVMAEVSWVVTM